MKTGIEKGRETYKTEAKEILENLEIALLALEKAPHDHALVDQVFRGLHTIKGSGAMFGFDAIVDFVHDLESVYDCIRDGIAEISPKLIDLTLSACDLIRSMLDEYLSDREVKLGKKEASLQKEFKKFLPEEKMTQPDSSNQSIKNTPEGKSLELYWIRFEPEPHLFKIGTDPILLLNELREMGQCEIVANIERLPSIKKLDPELCLVNWEIIIQTPHPENALRDVFIFVEGDCELQIDLVDPGHHMDPVSGYQYLAKELRKQHRLTHQIIDKAIKLFPKRKMQETEILVDENSSPLKETVSQLENGNSIRVASEKLDKLINLVGELVIIQSGLKQKVMDMANSELISFSEQIERLIWDLRDTSMDIRLLPVGFLFNKFHRLVRDLSREQGKHVSLVISGEETELDKSLVERLNNPLLHLIRNCIDHGIESPEQRKKTGKPEEGKVILSARRSGFDVLITVEDDGAGLDVERIRQKAIEKRLLDSGADISEQDLYPMIFMPGFSTKSTVSSVSGRGVGMDVVKRDIESLGGSVSISSGRNKGTTVTLQVPLTLGIIEGLLFKSGDDTFVIPLNVVQQCLDITGKGLSKGRRLLNVDGEMIPWIPLHELFCFTQSTSVRKQGIVTMIQGNKIAFIVDKIIGEQQIVIKPLGKMYRSVEGLSGATILGDGTVALILDVIALTENAILHENETIASDHESRIIEEAELCQDT